LLKSELDLAHQAEQVIAFTLDAKSLQGHSAGELHSRSCADVERSAVQGTVDPAILYITLGQGNQCVGAGVFGQKELIANLVDRERLPAAGRAYLVRAVLVNV
jgi:hypothetical protein